MQMASAQLMACQVPAAKRVRNAHRSRHRPGAASEQAQRPPPDPAACELTPEQMLQQFGEQGLREIQTQQMHLPRRGSLGAAAPPTSTHA